MREDALSRFFETWHAALPRRIYFSIARANSTPICPLAAQYFGIKGLFEYSAVPCRAVSGAQLARDMSRRHGGLAVYSGEEDLEMPYLRTQRYSVMREMPS